MSAPLRTLRPHVFEPDGAIATPDLLCAEVAVALAGSSPVPVGVHTLAADVAVRCAPGRTVAMPAWGVLAAARGTLLMPAVVHADLRALDAGDPWLACAAGPHLYARAARRLAEVCAHAPAVWMERIDGTADGGLARWTLAAAAAVHDGFAACLEGKTPRSECVHLFAMEDRRALHEGRAGVRIHGFGEPLVLEYEVLWLRDSGGP